MTARESSHDTTETARMTERERTFTTRVLVVLLVLSVAIGCKRKADGDPEEGTDVESQQRSDEQSEPEEPASPPVASVDGQTVLTQAELDATMDAIVERYETTGVHRRTNRHWRDVRRRRLVHEAVHEALIDRYVEMQGVEVSSAEVETELNERYPHFKDNDATFERYLESQGLERSKFMENLRRDIALEKVLRQRGRLEPGEDELRAQYERRQDQWRSEDRAFVHTALYRISTNDSEDSAEQTTERLRTDAEGIRDLSRFEEFARENSEGMNASDGGEIGWVFRGRSRLVSDPRIERAIFRTPLNRVSEPVRTSLGAQVFFVTDRREAGIRDFDEVREIIAVPLRRRRIQELRLQLINERRAEHNVEYHEENWNMEVQAGSPPN